MLPVCTGAAVPLWLQWHIPPVPKLPPSSLPPSPASAAAGSTVQPRRRCPRPVALRGGGGGPTGACTLNRNGKSMKLLPSLEVV